MNAVNLSLHHRLPTERGIKVETNAVLLTRNMTLATRHSQQQVLVDLEEGFQYTSLGQFAILLIAAYILQDEA